MIVLGSIISQGYNNYVDMKIWVLYKLFHIYAIFEICYSHNRELYLKYVNPTIENYNLHCDRPYTVNSFHFQISLFEI